jgi:hypothetical protein
LDCIKSLDSIVKSLSILSPFWIQPLPNLFVGSALASVSTLTSILSGSQSDLHSHNFSQNPEQTQQRGEPLPKGTTGGEEGDRRDLEPSERKFTMGMMTDIVIGLLHYTIMKSMSTESLQAQGTSFLV